MSKILVTGGAGFIGSHLVDRLLSLGNDVVVIDNMRNGLSKNFEHNILNNKKYKIYFNDILSEDVEKIFSLEKPEYVFHLAAIPSVPYSMKNPVETYSANVTGTFKLLDLSVRYKVKKFIFSSSSSVYGSNEKKPLSEYSELNPKSHYALQKKTAEEYCAFYTNTYGLDTICFRYFNVFGERQRDDLANSSIMSLFAKYKYNNKVPIIYGTGEQTRDFTYVHNVIDANILALETKYIYEGGSVYNVGGGNPISINDLAKVWGFKELRYENARDGDVLHSYADMSLIKACLKFENKVSLKDGINIYYEKYCELIK